MKGEVGVLAVGQRVGRRLHQRKRRPDLLERRLSRRAGRQPRRAGLDADAELVAALDVGDRLDAREAERHGADLAHVAAGALPRMDEPLLAQPLQRHPQHRPRHPELVRQRLLRGQLLVGRVVAVRDPAVEQVVDPVGEPRPLPRAVAGGRPFRPDLSGPSSCAFLPAAAASTTETRAVLGAESAGLGDKLHLCSPTTMLETGTPGKISPSMSRTPDSERAEDRVGRLAAAGEQRAGRRRPDKLRDLRAKRAPARRGVEWPPLGRRAEPAAHRRPPGAAGQRPRPAPVSMVTNPRRPHRVDLGEGDRVVRADREKDRRRQSRPDRPAAPAQAAGDGRRQPGGADEQRRRSHPAPPPARRRGRRRRGYPVPRARGRSPRQRAATSIGAATPAPAEPAPRRCALAPGSRSDQGAGRPERSATTATSSATWPFRRESTFLNTISGRSPTRVERRRDAARAAAALPSRDAVLTLRTSGARRARLRRRRAAAPRRSAGRSRSA